MHRRACVCACLCTCLSWHLPPMSPSIYLPLPTYPYPPCLHVRSCAHIKCLCTCTPTPLSARSCSQLGALAYKATRIPVPHLPRAALGRLGEGQRLRGAAPVGAGVVRHMRAAARPSAGDASKPMNMTAPRALGLLCRSRRGRQRRARGG